MELRVRRQAGNAERIAGWLNDALNGRGESNEVVKKVVSKVVHASLQVDDFPWLKKQMPNGFGPVFSFYMKTAEQARQLPSHLRLFHHATSLGGVESLIEWRRMSDTEVDERLLRVSVGVENWEDLRDDFVQAFEKLAGGEEPAGERKTKVQVGGEAAKVEGGADGAV